MICVSCVSYGVDSVFVWVKSILCFMWLFLSLAMLGVYLSSYASHSCIECVFIVAFLQDGDLTPMIVARYLHRYNDDTRPAMSMESFCYQCNSNFFPRSCYGF